MSKKKDDQKQLADLVGDLKPKLLELKLSNGEVAEIPLEPFCTFKTAHVLKLLAGVRERVDVVQLLSELVVLASPAEDVQARARQLGAAVNSVPQILSLAPDLLTEFAALAITPNAALEQSFEEKGDAGVQEAVAERRKLIAFRTGADAPLKVLRAFIPLVGVDFIRAELGNLNELVVTMFGTKTTPPEEPTETS